MQAAGSVCRITRGSIACRSGMQGDTRSGDMRICYNCFQEAEDSSLFCENCGSRLGVSNESVFPAALACGTTLYGRYLVGRALGQDDLCIFYIALDSRTKETVVLREYFPGMISTRSSFRSVIISEEERSAFQQGKELFLEEAEALSDLVEETDAAGLQCFFNQNDTAYEAIRYTDTESLRKFLEKVDGMQFRKEAEQIPGLCAPDAGSPSKDTERAGIVFPENLPGNSGSTLSEAPPQEAGGVSAAQGEGAPAEPHEVSEAPPQEAGGVSAAQGEGAPAEPPVEEETVSQGEGAPAEPPVEAAAVSHGEGTPAEPPEEAETARTARPGRAGGGGAGTGRRKSSALPALVSMVVLMAVAAAAVLFLFRGTSDIIGRYYRNYEARRQAEKLWREMRDRIPKIDPGPEAGPETYREGISSGNYHNSGDFAFCDGDLYYVSSYILYRCDGADPERAERIAGEGPGYLNSWNGSLYYLTEITEEIRRYDPDEGREITLFETSSAPELAPTSLYIWEDWCYFAHKMHLYRISMETLDSGTAGPEDAELVTEDFNADNYVFPSICFLKGDIYYNGVTGLTRRDLAGRKGNRVSDRNGSLVTDGSAVYSWYGTRDVYRIETDGTMERLPFPDNEGRIRGINYCEGKLYYIMDDGEEYSLWRTETDGSGAECLQIISSSQDIIVSFCVFPGEDNAYIKRLIQEDSRLEFVIEKYPLQ